MKLNGGKAEAFLKSPRDSVRAILFFGPDSGLIRERGKALVSHFADTDDPFAVTEVSGGCLKERRRTVIRRIQCNVSHG